MDSIKKRINYGKFFSLMVLLMILTCSCTIGRVYMGSEVRHDPKEKILIGSTTKGQILEIFGPPERVHLQFDGDIFVYAYFRKNSSKLVIGEPYVTKITFFAYTRIQEKKDSLVILFDKNGVVKNFGFNRGTPELTTF